MYLLPTAAIGGEGKEGGGANSLCLLLGDTQRSNGQRWGERREQGFLPHLFSPSPFVLFMWSYRWNEKERTNTLTHPAHGEKTKKCGQNR
jgi:hypothetical protein